MDKNRRRFLKGMAALGAIFGTKLARADSDTEYRGWKLHWTGWKSSDWSFLLVAQWLANRDGEWLYASTTGYMGKWIPYQVINLVACGQCPAIWSHSSKEEMDASKKIALKRMCELIDHRIDGGMDEYIEESVNRGSKNAHI